jgi:hypothetical protein
MMPGRIRVTRPGHALSDPPMHQAIDKYEQSLLCFHECRTQDGLSMPVEAMVHDDLCL